MGEIHWMKPNGDRVIKRFANEPPPIEEVQKFVDGWVEFVRVLDEDGQPQRMLVNDEGLLRHLPINPEASLLYARNSLKRFGQFPPTPIAGNAVLLIDLDYD